MRLLVIGGSDAGISAGLRARHLDPSVEVSLLVADAFPNFSICGLPYYPGAHQLHLRITNPGGQPRDQPVNPPTSERRVLFVCTHNAGRSIVAAALLNAHQPPGVRADSAGTDPADAINTTVVTALAERGITLTGVSPKPITGTLVAAADLVITMGRHASGPILPGVTARQQHWQLDFPGDDLEAMRTFCDQVDGRVQALLADLRSSGPDSRPSSQTV